MVLPWHNPAGDVNPRVIVIEILTRNTLVSSCSSSTRCQGSREHVEGSPLVDPLTSAGASVPVFFSLLRLWMMTIGDSRGGDGGQAYSDRGAVEAEEGLQAAYSAPDASAGTALLVAAAMNRWIDVFRECWYGRCSCASGGNVKWKFLKLVCRRLYEYTYFGTSKQGSSLCPSRCSSNRVDGVPCDRLPPPCAAPRHPS